MAEERRLLDGDAVEQALASGPIGGQRVDVGVGCLSTGGSFVPHGAAEPAEHGRVRAEPEVAMQQAGRSIDNLLGAVDCGHGRISRTARTTLAAMSPSATMSLTAPRR